MNLIHFLRGFTIRSRMLSAIAMVLVLLAGVGASGFTELRRVASIGDHFVAQVYEHEVLLRKLQLAVAEIRHFEKDCIIKHATPRDVAEERKRWQYWVGEARKLAQQIAAVSSEESAAAARQIDGAIAAYTEAAGPALEKILEGNVESSAAANQLIRPAKPAVHSTEEGISKLREVFARESEAAIANRVEATSRAYRTFVAALLLAVILLVPFTLANTASICRPIDDAQRHAQRIATGDLSAPMASNGADETAQMLHALTTMQDSLRRIVGQVRDASERVQVASSEVASGNLDLSQRTEEAACSLQATARSMEQLTATVNRSAESANTANQLAGSAAQIAQRGGDVVSKVVSTMDDIHESSKKIADIISVIDGIAFQTNILALNAAVEAARAGEQGRGFAIVAGEVRSLAQRSAEAAKEIKTLINTSVSKVEAGSRLVQDAGSTMSEIVDSVQLVSNIVKTIAATSNEQSSGIGQVNTSVAQLDRVTQQNAALVEQSAAAAESLKEQSMRLADVVSAFRLASGTASGKS